MQYVKLGDTYLLRLDSGEEVFAALARFAADRRIDAGSVSGIGSVHHAVLGYFDRETKEYLKRTIEPDSEIVSLAGNIAVKEGRAFPHVHAVLGTRDFVAVAGHLFEATVAATCELMVRPLRGIVMRQKDEPTGLWLWNL